MHTYVLGWKYELRPIKILVQTQEVGQVVILIIALCMQALRGSWYKPGVSTLAGELTSSFPKITAEETSSAYLSFFTSSGPVPRPRISTDLSTGLFESDLYLLSSYVPSTVPVTV